MKPINNMIKLVVCMCAVAFCTVLSGCGEKVTVTETVQEDSGAQAAGEESTVSETITVFVCGAVCAEGVYELSADSIKDDALQAAGGFAEGADTSGVNLAEAAADGERIYFPYEGETPGNDAGDDGDGLVDINTADVAALTSLPGIGETRAERIVAYRKAHGAFADKSELKNVSGIGESIYEGLEDYITAK